MLPLLAVQFLAVMASMAVCIMSCVMRLPNAFHERQPICAARPDTVSASPSAWTVRGGGWRQQLEGSGACWWGGAGEQTGGVLASPFQPGLYLPS